MRDRQTSRACSLPQRPTSRVCSSHRSRNCSWLDRLRSAEKPAAGAAPGGAFSTIRLRRWRGGGVWWWWPSGSAGAPGRSTGDGAPRWPLALHVAGRAVHERGPEVLRGVDDGRRALQAHHAGDGHAVQPELPRFAEQIGIELHEQRRHRGSRGGPRRAGRLGSAREPAAMTAALSTQDSAERAIAEEPGCARREMGRGRGPGTRPARGAAVAVGRYV